MDGYDEHTYGDAFADVYDEWYQGVSDVDATIATLSRLAGPDDRHADPKGDGSSGRRRVLELGVGTGRLALPLAVANPDTMEVTGVDTSRAMLDRLRERDLDDRVVSVEADMVTGLPDGPFALVFVAYNTLFNLTRRGQQQECFRSVAARLAPGGRFVVEAFVPDDPPRDGDDISIRSMEADRVVLSITRQSAATGLAEGHFVELTESNGVRLRPWSIRHRTPAGLDALATAAGLTLESRWEDMSGTTYTPDSDRHVSVYRSRAGDSADNSDASIT